MKAAVLHAPLEPMTVEDVVIEKPKRREVLVRTAAAGLCHSDFHFIEGSYPTPCLWSSAMNPLALWKPSVRMWHT